MKEDAALQAAVDDYLRRNGATKCPAAAAAPTSAILDSAGLAAKDEARHRRLIAKAAKIYTKGRIKWLQGKSRKSSERRAKLP